MSSRSSRRTRLPVVAGRTRATLAVAALVPAVLIGTVGSTTAATAAPAALARSGGGDVPSPTLLVPHLVDPPAAPAAAPRVPSWDGLENADPVAPGGRGGKATPRCFGQKATIVGTKRDDDISGTVLADVVVLKGGDDTFRDIAGDDVVCGGAGDDVIGAGSGDDVVVGGAGDDQITGENGKDLIYGGRGVDAIEAGDDNDQVDAGPDADYVLEGDGADRTNGGSGADYLSYFSSTTGITVRHGNVVAGPGGTDRLRGIETVEGTGEADVMTGTAGSDDFRSLTGKDRVRTLGGDDVVVAGGGRVVAGAGNDQVLALLDARVDLGPGTDAGRVLKSDGVTITGGTGDDYFEVDARRSTSRIDGGPGLAQLNLAPVARGVRVDLARGTASWQHGSLRVAGVQNVIGTNRADRFSGTRRYDLFFGLRGNDVMIGGGGADTLVGAGGVDSANGGSGVDVCDAERKVACEV